MGQLLSCLGMQSNLLANFFDLEERFVRHCQVDRKLVDHLPQDTRLKPVVNPRCWASETAVSLSVTIPSPSIRER